MSQSPLCSAIRAKHLVRFYYADPESPGFRTVEPHMVAYTSTDHLALSAWYLSGASESQEGQDWRIYLLSEMTQVTELEQQFSGPRHGYRRDGGKSFHNVQCTL